MLKVTVCIGSSCHIKGSRQIIERLESLITEYGMKEKIDFGGTFCMGKCTEGVCVTVDGVLHSVSPDTVDVFFKEHILEA